MFIKSIRWRLQIFHGLILLLVLAGFGYTAYNLDRNSRFQRVDQELQRRVTTLASVVRPMPPSGPRHGPRNPGEDRMPVDAEFQLSPHQADLFDGNETNSFYYVVWAPDARIQTRSTNAPVDLEMPLRVGSNGDDQSVRIRGEMREAIHFTPHGRCILVGVPIRNEISELKRLAWWLVAAGGGVWLLGSVGGSWAASHAMRPIEDIGATASRISAGNLSERINIADTDTELGRLATVLNTTFERLDAAFSQQKQFTADASHELRTPLAALITEAQVSLARPRSSTEYRQTVEACLDAAQQMRRLTDSLLVLARFDAGQEKSRTERLDLAEKVREAVEFTRSLGEERRVGIRCELASAICLGDSDRVGQVITNLLINAIYYNRPGGEVRIATQSGGQTAVLIVSDTGIGISGEDLPRIFERFYRADKSRSCAEGRSGLGLAICKAIVEAHGGQITAASEEGVGSMFTVTLPNRVSKSQPNGNLGG